MPKHTPQVETLRADDRDELMDFLNRAFGFGAENGFEAFLPKYYKKEYDPCRNQLAMRKNGRICAVAGLEPLDLRIAGESLRVCAVGNVAVDESMRGRGLMSALMSRAVEILEKEGYDCAVLGGKRQRYATFGFEPAGSDYRFEIDRSNIRHCFGHDPFLEWRATEVLPTDEETLRLMAGLQARQPHRAERNPEKLYETLCSWGYRPFALMNGMQFAGYCLMKETEVRELVLESAEDFDGAVCAICRAGQTCSLIIPSYDRELLCRAERIAEDYRIEHWEKFRVFLFLPTVRAMLALRAVFEKPADGELTVCVRHPDGQREERFRIAVCGGKPEVTELPPCRSTELTLSYEEAMSFFFSEFSGKRGDLEPAVQRWFPLSLTVSMADHI